MAEGEFALIREYGEAGLIRPSKGWATFGDHDLYSLLADAAAAQCDEAALRQYAPLAEETARRYDHTLYRAIADRARGVSHRLAGEYNEAESQLNQALDIFNGLNTYYQIGRTLSDLGELAAARTESGKARAYFTRALEAFGSLEAVPDTMRAKAALERLQ
jgi:tetratricopeptide (TPR) repeat protein